AKCQSGLTGGSLNFGRVGLPRLFAIGTVANDRAKACGGDGRHVARRNLGSDTECVGNLAQVHGRLLWNVSSIWGQIPPCFNARFPLTFGAHRPNVSASTKGMIMGKSWEFWIDRGGTFTDIVALDPSG